MIKINLLPVREERRKLGLRQQLILFLLVMVLVAIGLFYWNTFTNGQIKTLRTQITQIEKEIQRLDAVVKDVEKFKKDKKVLEGKLDVIGRLQKDRKIAVHYMDELNRALPEKVWLEFWEERAGTITIRGKALSPDDIAAFLRNLDASEYFSEVELVETVQNDVALGTMTIKVNDFLISFKAGEPGRSAKPATKA